MITVILNGNETSIKPNTMLSNAITLWGYTGGSFAIALNEKFVPNGNYASITIKENDKIEVVSAMQGG